MSYMTRYDMVNVKQFKEGKQNGYLCSMCGQYSILPDSVSHQMKKQGIPKPNRKLSEQYRRAQEYV